MDTLNFLGTFHLFSLPLLQVPVADNLIVDSNFFITIAAGVILALAFQFILTAVSVAAGITAIGDVKKSYVKAKVRPVSDDDPNGHEFDQDSSPDMAAGVKITTAFGIWSLVTTSIALFGATALALNINMVETSATNTTTALVIWGLFFLILFYLETRIVGSLLGNLFTAVTSGLKSSAGAISSMFTASPDKKIENVLEHTIDKVRSEFDSGFDMDKVSDVLDNFLDRVDSKIPDYDNLKNDLEDIAKKSSGKNTSGKWMAVQQVLTKLISENSKSSDPGKKSKAEKLQRTLDTITQKYREGENSMEGAINVVEELSSMDRGELDKRTEQIKEYLSSSAVGDFSPEKIKTAFRAILDHPKMVASILTDRAKGLDRENIIDALSSNTALKKEDLEKYADRATDMVRSVSHEFDAENENGLVKKIEGRVEGFFEGTGRRELDYSLLKDDVRKILDNPKDSLDIIRNRASSFDTDTLRALVTNNKYVSDEQVDSIVKTFSDTKNQVLDKIGRIEAKAHEQVKILERKAVIQAEHARLTAASAAWWLVLTTIISAVAAIGGGIVTLPF
ncbi:hypothetical protein [Pricia sp.]|uniref:hypothetical protein n=1 Tax=Pricia sp. TaxID=2268138 RepID=UPI0035936792